MADELEAKRDEGDGEGGGDGGASDPESIGVPLDGMAATIAVLASRLGGHVVLSPSDFETIRSGRLLYRPGPLGTFSLTVKEAPCSTG